MADLANGLQAVLRGPSQEPLVQSPAGSEMGDSPRQDSLPGKPSSPQCRASADVPSRSHEQEPSQVGTSQSPSSIKFAQMTVHSNLKICCTSALHF